MDAYQKSWWTCDVGRWKYSFGVQRSRSKIYKSEGHVMGVSVEKEEIQGQNSGRLHRSQFLYYFIKFLNLSSTLYWS